MTTRPPEQLALPSTLAEATELRQQLTILQGRAARWEAVAHEWEQLAYTRQRERDEARHTIENLALKVRAQEMLLELTSGRPSSSAPAAIPAWLPQELRKLLTMAHPDKWSQGQAAAELAHEVASTVNTLRQRLGEGQ